MVLIRFFGTLSNQGCYITVTSASLTVHAKTDFANLQMFKEFDIMIFNL